MTGVFLKRGLLMLIAAALWFVFWKKILRGRLWDIFIICVGVALSINYYFIAGERALYDPQFYQHPAYVAASLFWIVSFTFMVPIYTILPKIITTVLFTTLVIFRMTSGIMASHEGIVLVVAYLLISTVCLLISLRSERYRRQIFLQYQQELSTRSALEKALVIEEKFNRAEQQMLKTAAELQLLSAQIKPHFLTNVLFTAIALCRTKPDLAINLLENLTVYTTSAVHADQERVKLSEELAVVQSYLDIQKIRMGERLQFEIRRDYLTDIMIPVYAIQTLVENSIIHGLHDRDDGGEIIIDIAGDTFGLRVAVSDNGLGIDAELVRGLFSGDQLSARLQEKRSIGLWNVNRRLQLLGSRGLCVNSVPGEGTEVSFELPVSKPE